MEADHHTLLVCLIAGLVYVYSSTKMYQATAQIFVSTASSDNSPDLAQGNTFTQARVQSYTSQASIPGVTDPVVTQLGLKITADQLASEISANAPLNKGVAEAVERERKRRDSHEAGPQVGGRPFLRISPMEINFAMAGSEG